jgi:putative N6-adenine-specific DNA methylase
MDNTVSTPILITTPKGLTTFLREELQRLKYPVKKVGAAGVLTEGDYTDAMRLNLYLFTAHHVLFLVNEFSCNNPQDLYRKINAIPWETMISADGYLSVVSNVVHSSIRDTRFANLKTKDAIVDRILIRKGRRPDSGPQRNRAVIHIYWRDEKCQVYIDTSGEPYQNEDIVPTLLALRCRRLWQQLWLRLLGSKLRRTSLTPCVEVVHCYRSCFAEYQ